MVISRDTDIPDWRNELDQPPIVKYKKRFAITPKVCADGTKLWLESYYKKYNVWGSKDDVHQIHSHTDFIEDITEAEYIVRKLSENL